MCEKIGCIQDLLDQLPSMTTATLLSKTLFLQAQNQKNEALLIAHIGEISKRKAHVDLGHPHLFSYVTRELGVSEGAAACRIQVARVFQKYPQILHALAAGDINLTVAGRISPVLTADNCAFLLQKCRRMSTRDVLALLVDLRLHHEAECKPSLRKVSAGPQVEHSGSNKINAQLPEPKETSETKGSALSAGNPLSTKADREGVPGAAVLPQESFLLLMGERLAPRATEAPSSNIAGAARYNIKLSISAALKTKIDRLAEVIGMADAVCHLEKIIDQAVSDSLDRRDPIHKDERRRKKARKAGLKDTESKRGASALTMTTANGVSSTTDMSGVSVTTRGKPHKAHEVDSARKLDCRVGFTHLGYVSAEVRAATLHQANYRCEFMAPNGERCSARHALEIDHITPKSHGGSGELNNLQVLCHSHNIRKAELDLGETFVRTIIERKLSAREQLGKRAK